MARTASQSKTTKKKGITEVEHDDDELAQQKKARLTRRRRSRSGDSQPPPQKMLENRKIASAATSIAEDAAFINNVSPSSSSSGNGVAAVSSLNSALPSGAAITGITPTHPHHVPITRKSDLLLLWFVVVLTMYALFHVLFTEHRGVVDPPLVFWSAWITMATTGLGVVPFAFISTDSLNKRYVAVMNALAAGMMLSASMGLLEEGLADTRDDAAGGLHSALFRVSVGLCLGVLFIWQSKNTLDEQESFHVMELDGLDAKKVALIMCVMTLHSLSEGIGIGVSYNSHSLGSFISLTMAVHNIPEGIAIAIVMIPRGVSKTRSALWCVFSSFPQPVMAVPAYLFVEAFRPLFSIGLGFAAGAMSYVAIFELLHDASEVLSMGKALLATSFAALMMIFLQIMIRED
jgi:ZIP family zinc transporter